MADSRTHRIMKDLGDFHRHPIDGIIITDYDEIHLRQVEVLTVGPIESPYAAGTFGFTIRLPAEFPFTAPKVSMSTPIWHPNISSSGRVCMNVLSSWCPATTLLELAEAVRALLAFPNSSSPLNTEAAWMMDTDMQMFSDTAKMWTSVFANGPVRPEDYNTRLTQVMEVLEYTEERALRTLTTLSWDVTNVVRQHRRYRSHSPLN